LQGYVQPEVPAGTQAAVFAKHLHNAWGVGDAACNNGVVLLLAIEERQVCILNAGCWGVQLLFSTKLWRCSAALARQDVV